MLIGCLFVCVSLASSVLATSCSRLFFHIYALAKQNSIFFVKIFALLVSFSLSLASALSVFLIKADAADVDVMRYC